jgi:hypothetical protein
MEAAGRRPAEEADVTEGKWLKATDPTPMLEYLRAKNTASERRLRLFAVACSRRILHLLPGEVVEYAVRLHEGFADSAGCDQEMKAAAVAAVQDRAEAHPEAGANYQGLMGVVITSQALSHPLFELGVHCLANAVAWAAAPTAVVEPDDWSSPKDPRWRAARAGERAAQADVLRDLFGNPLRAKPAIDPAWLAWNDGIVKRLAEGIYAERAMPAGTLDPQRLAVLADALEEAGADAELVAHLRNPGPHYRGCFVLDLLLDKSERKEVGKPWRTAGVSHLV